MAWTAPRELSHVGNYYEEWRILRVVIRLWKSKLEPRSPPSVKRDKTSILEGNAEKYMIIPSS